MADRLDPGTVRMIRRLAAQVSRHDRQLKAVSRAPQLAHSSVEDGSIDENDLDGNLASRFGKQHDGTHATVVFTGPPPPAPAGVTASGSVLSATATWDGTFAGGAVAPMDLARVEVHASAVDGFTPDPLPASDTRVGTIESAGGGSLTFAADPGDLFVVLLARSASGKFSDPSGQVHVTVTAAVDDADLQAIRDDLTAAETTLAQARQDIDTNETTIAQTTTALDTAKHDLYDQGGRVDTALTGPVDGDRLVADTVVANTVVVPGSVGTTLIADGAVTTAKITANAITAGTIAALAVSTDKLAASAVTADKIAANTITAAKIVAQSITGDKIAANTITADNLAANTITAGQINASSIAGAVGQFVKVQAENIQAGNITAQLGITTGGSIIAGDPAAANATMSPDGFTTHALASDGTQYQSTTFGSPEGDALEIIADPAQPPVAAISSAGDISGNTLASNGDITIQGVPLLGKVLDPAADFGLADQFARGVIAHPVDFRDVVTGITIPDGGTTAPIGQFTATLYPNRVYQFSMPWRGYLRAPSGATPRTNITVRLYANHSSGPETAPPDPTINDVALGEQSQNYYTNGPGTDDTLTFQFATPDITGPAQFKFLLGMWASGGSFSPDTQNVVTRSAWIGTLTDVGRVPFPSPVTPPGAATRTTFATTWRASDSHAWLGSGERYDTGGSRPAAKSLLLQGGTANSHSAVLFNGGAITGEIGRTIAQCYANSLLVKAEVFLYQTWSEQDVGQVQVRPWTGTTLPASKAAPLGTSNKLTHDYTARAQGAWIQVPTDWISATQTGIWIASPDWLFPNTHTNLAGAAPTSGLARAPLFRATYQR